MGSPEISRHVGLKLWNGLSLIQFAPNRSKMEEHRPERLEIKLVYVVERRIRLAFNYSSLEHIF